MIESLARCAAFDGREGKKNAVLVFSYLTEEVFLDRANGKLHPQVVSMGKPLKRLHRATDNIVGLDSTSHNLHADFGVLLYGLVFRAITWWGCVGVELHVGVDELQRDPSVSLQSLHVVDRVKRWGSKRKRIRYCEDLLRLASKHKSTSSPFWGEISCPYAKITS